MSPNRFPEGWDEKKVQRVLAYYADPRNLVPKIRALIAKEQG